MMAQCVGTQGQVKVAKNTPIVAFPPNKPHRKRKLVIFDFDYKTCCLEQLSSSIAWRVIGLQSSARNVVFEGIKGSKVKGICCTALVFSLSL